MEHIVQFAIGIDDDAIVKRVSENAEQQITNALQLKVEESMFEYDPYRGKNRIVGVQKWVKDQFDAFLDEHKEKIIEIAAKQLADKLYRSKAVKEVIAESITKE